MVNPRVFGGFPKDEEKHQALQTLPFETGAAALFRPSDSPWIRVKPREPEAEASTIQALAAMIGSPRPRSLGERSGQPGERIGTP